MQSETTEFSGRLLSRGFWIYVWSIRFGRVRLVYVGRTGDSSSINAASPFSRIGAHLNLKDGARGNALARNIRGQGLDPARCHFQMLAIGPLFPEQTSLQRHLRHRDQVAAIERALADALRERGMNVLGSHPRRGEVPADLMRRIVSRAERFLGLR